MKDDRIEQYEFVATLDMRTSDICQEHDGKIYDVDKATVGVNCPPLHPFCRSTTVPYFGEKEGTRAARGADGKTYYVPANMTYEQWYQKYVVDRYGKEQAEITRKKIKNETADKKQFKRYKEVLGNDASKSFEKFQELKYNNPEDWKKLKKKYVLNSKTAYLQSRFDYILNGEELFIPNKTIITNAKIIAGNGSDTELRVANELVQKYGGKAEEWSKKVGKIESARYIFDIHWYELDGVQYEMKLKYRGDKK